MKPGKKKLGRPTVVTPQLLADIQKQTMHDSLIARKHGRSPPFVTYTRKSLGLPRVEFRTSSISGALEKRIMAALAQAKQSDADLSRRFKVSYGIVRRLRKKCELPAIGKRGRKSKLSSEMAKAIKARDRTDAAIASEFNVHPGTVQHHRRKMGIAKIRLSKPRGSAFHKVNELRIKNPDMSLRQMASEVGVSYQRVQQLLTGYMSPASRNRCRK